MNERAGVSLPCHAKDEVRTIPCMVGAVCKRTVRRICRMADAPGRTSGPFLAPETLVAFFVQTLAKHRHRFVAAAGLLGMAVDTC